MKKTVETDLLVNYIKDTVALVGELQEKHKLNVSVYEWYRGISLGMLLVSSFVQGLIAEEED